MGHARAIVGLKNHGLMKEVAAQTIKNEWSVRELEDYIQKLEQPEKKSRKPKPQKTDPYIRQLEETLREQFRTKVSIKHNKNKGKIELLYYSREDLERLLELLRVKIG
jgi:ParB family chromosome partitioning protein